MNLTNWHLPPDPSVPKPQPAQQALPSVQKMPSLENAPLIIRQLGSQLENNLASSAAAIPLDIKVSQPNSFAESNQVMQAIFVRMNELLHKQQDPSVSAKFSYCKEKSKLWMCGLINSTGKESYQNQSSINSLEWPKDFMKF